MTDTKLLEQTIAENGLKESFVAEQIGISQASFIKKKNNVCEFKASEIDKLKTILKIDSLAKLHRIFFTKKVE